MKGYCDAELVNGSLLVPYGPTLEDVTPRRFKRLMKGSRINKIKKEAAVETVKKLKEASVRVYNLNAFEIVKKCNDNGLNISTKSLLEICKPVNVSLCNLNLLQMVNVCCKNDINTLNFNYHGQ